MKLSKRLRKWKGNLTTQTPIDYVITLRADINGFADEVKALEKENAKLRVLARTNWFVALSERDALRIHGVDPDGGAYIRALDMTMDESRATMRELGIEVE